MANHRRSPSPASDPASIQPASWRARGIALAVLLAFATLLLLPYWHGHWRLADDAYDYHLPTFRFLERVLAQGQWPHWNLNEGFGKPTAVNVSMYYYPPVPIWSLIVGWTETSYLGFLLLHLFAGAALAFRFSRRMRHTIEASVFFALAYSGNGYALGFFSNPSLLFPYLFWPLLAEGLLDLQRSGGAPAGETRLAMPKIALALYLIETSGYPLVKLLIYLSTAIAALPLARAHWRALSLSAAVALLASAPEWATALRALPLSERMSADIYGAISYDSPSNFLAIGTMLVPTAFLKRDGYQLAMVWLERSWWVGSLTLAVALAAFGGGALRLGRYRRHLLIALGGTLFAFGGHSFFRELSSVLIPLLEHLRFANMGRMIPMALLVFLGAAGLDALQRSPSSQKGANPKARKRVTTLWALFGLACALAALSHLDTPVYSVGLYLDPSTRWEIGALHTAFYLLLAYSAHALRVSWGTRAGWATALVAIQFLSLADVGYAFRRVVAKEVPARSAPASAEPAGAFTPASPQPNVRSVRQWLDGNDWVRWDGNLKVLNAYTVPYHRWMRETIADPRTARFASTLASCQENAAELGLRDDIPGPHSCAGAGFRIDRHYGNTIELSGRSDQPAWILVHDFVDPGWRAELDGKAVPIQAAFGRFKAVEVPASPHGWRLRMEYRHPWFPALWLASALGFVLLAAMTVLAARGRLSRL